MYIAFFCFWIIGSGISSQDGISLPKSTALWQLAVDLPLSLAAVCTTDSREIGPPNSVSLLTLDQRVLCVLSGLSPHLIPVFQAMFKVLKLTPASVPSISPFRTTLPEPHPPSLSLLRKQPSSSFQGCASPQTRVVRLAFIVEISTASRFTGTGFILPRFKIFGYSGL